MRGVVRGKFAECYLERLRIVRLAEDVAASFPDEAAVNDALREYLHGRGAQNSTRAGSSATFTADPTPLPTTGCTGIIATPPCMPRTQGHASAPPR